MIKIAFSEYMFFLPNFLQKGELKELHSDIPQEAIVFVM
jgi:hypothetical protein